MTTPAENEDFARDEDPTDSDLSIEDMVAQGEDDPPPAAGPLSTVGSAIVVGAIGIIGIVGSLDLGLGTLTVPGAGLWPFILSVILVFLAIALAVIAPRIPGSEKFTSSSWGVLVGMLTIVGLVILLPVIGFEIPTLLLGFFWLKVLGKETWRMATLLNVVIVAAFYVIFVVLLNVPLPHLF